MEPAEGQEEDDMEPCGSAGGRRNGGPERCGKRKKRQKEEGAFRLRKLLVFLVIVLALLFGGLYLAVGVRV